MKTRGLAQALAERDWLMYVELHDRPYRVGALLELVDDHGLSDEKLWQVVGWVWVDTEGAWLRKEWRSIWSRKDQHRNFVTDEKELEVLKSLPDDIEIWRGVKDEEGVQGLSWTLERDTAIYFAGRFVDVGDRIFLARGRVKKHDVLAYFCGRRSRNCNPAGKRSRIASNPVSNG